MVMHDLVRAYSMLRAGDLGGAEQVLADVIAGAAAEVSQVERLTRELAGERAARDSQRDIAVRLTAALADVTRDLDDARGSLRAGRDTY